jgi:hypothetical protein
MADRKLHDMVVFVHQETAGAVLVSEDEKDRENAVWLPKSQIEIEPKATVLGVLFHDLTLPEWLAIEKGLV